MRFGDFVFEEWRILRRHGIAIPALVGLTLLLLGAALNGRAVVGMHAVAMAALQSEAATTRSAMAAQAGRGVKTAMEPGAMGFSVLDAPAILPAAALGVLATGQVDLLPSHYAVTARAEHTFMSSTELDNPLRLAIGSFDVAFVIVWLLPLVVIALCFDLVSGDRERGVLALAAAAGVRLGPFIFGKCAARAAILLVALTIALILAGLAAGIGWGASNAPGLYALWIAASTLYALFWFAICMFVNSVPRTSDSNAGILAAMWLLFVVVSPALTNLAATTVFPAPSRVALTTELREATEIADRESAKARDRYFFDHPDMQSSAMDTGAYYRSVAQSETQVSRAMRPLLEAFDTQAQRQQTIVNALQYLSPGTLIYQVLTALAGSDGQRHREFRSQVRVFHSRWSGFFVERLAIGSALTGSDYQQLPQFRFGEPVTRQVIDRTAAPLLLLLFLTVLLGWWAVRRLARFPIV